MRSPLARWIGAAVMTALLSTAGLARAQSYPVKPITLVSAFPAGSAAEILGRIVGQRLQQRWGQPVVVESRPGAGGTIGAASVARSAPDGYTMLVGSSGETTIGVSMYRNLPYETLRDLAPVIAIGPMPQLLVVHPSLPATTVAELVALAKSKPKELDFASTGNGSTSQLAMELFKMQASIDMTHVPYKGSQPALADTLAGRTVVMWGPMATVLPQVRAGKLRVLAVSTTKRSTTAPEIVTMSEAGFPGYEASIWWGILAPAATPKEIVSAVNTEVNAILQMPEVRTLLNQSGVEPAGGTPEAYGALLKAEITKWAGVIKASGARVD